MDFEYVVIGAGMIGAAAGRYLSEQSDSVAIIGNAEPADIYAHNENFGSHYDQGRITRGLDSKALWSELAIASLEAYPEIEEKSRIKFYFEAGCIQVGPSPKKTDDYIAKTAAVGFAHSLDFQNYSTIEYGLIRPELAFPDGFAVLEEKILSGYINPRDLVQAQLNIAAGQGATLIRQQVNDVSTKKEGVTLTLSDGTQVQAKKVLVAAGAWSEFLLNQSFDFEVRPRTILLARLSDAEAERLADIPSVILYKADPNIDVDGFYMLPPIRYPDGHIYLKIGAALKNLHSPTSAAELNNWFKSMGSAKEAAGLKEAIFDMVPGLKAEEIIYRTCVVTGTPDSNPIWRELEENRLYICAGGNGAAAKSSNEIGRRAAQMVTQ
ncbi:MAG: NAD(P)/FAD-dependent oxidoreductase [Anaerolineae bacterium]